MTQELIETRDNGVLTLVVPRPKPPEPKHIQIAGGDNSQTQT